MIMIMIASSPFWLPLTYVVRDMIVHWQDKKLKNVILSEKYDKKAAMFKVRSVPYPFTSREQYERSLKHAIGKEWNTHNSVRALTKPEVMTKPGVIIAPLTAPKRKKNRE